MKRLCVILIVFVAANQIFAQSDYPCLTCLPQGITFSSQSQIDNFTTNYPNCTQIDGDVAIRGNLISDLNGLNVIRYIKGNFDIDDNLVLTSLEGLSNLDSVGGSFYIRKNPSLNSLLGLEGLKSVGGAVLIAINPSLHDLSGLNNLSTIGNTLSISQNPNLITLTGIEKLTIVKGFLYIGNNPKLQNIRAFEKLSFVGGYLTLDSNRVLSSLNGLEHLTKVGLSVQISNNAALLNLSGLDSLNSVGFFLSVYNNKSLTSLIGLGELSAIGFYLAIQNNELLSDLNGMHKLFHVGELIIDGNPILTSLEGLENISTDSVTELILKNNPYLSTCAVKSICEYLVNPNATIQISNNASGCSSKEEVQAHCDTLSIESLDMGNNLNVYPNPANDFITLESPLITQNSTLTIADVNGQVVITQAMNSRKMRINVSALTRGVFFLMVQGQGNVQVGKFIKN